MGVFGTTALPRHLSSPLEGLQLLWEALLPCRFPAVWRGVVSYLQYWQCQGCLELYCFRRSPRTGTTGEGESFRIWKPSGEGKVDLSQPKGQILWPTRTASGAGSWHFWHRGCSLPQQFSEGIVTRHQQLRLPCLDGNRFESSIKKVSEPSGLAWSLNSLCPWIDKGCCGL